jgi:hypothetical protein
MRQELASIGLPQADRSGEIELHVLPHFWHVLPQTAASRFPCMCIEKCAAGVLKSARCLNGVIEADRSQPQGCPCHAVPRAYYSKPF